MGGVAMTTYNWIMIWLDINAAIGVWLVCK